MTEAKIYVPATDAKSPARTYNQVHSPRKFTQGRRRVSIYVCFVVLIGVVLAAELVNTALERALDGLHPGEAEFVRIAKDCAAGAVLVLSATAVVVFVVMLVAMLQPDVR